MIWKMQRAVWMGGPFLVAEAAKGCRGMGMADSTCPQIIRPYQTNSISHSYKTKPFMRPTDRFYLAWR